LHINLLIMDRHIRYFFEKKNDQSPTSYLDTAMENHRVSDWFICPGLLKRLPHSENFLNSG
jgi:hypothetical protein